MVGKPFLFSQIKQKKIKWHIDNRQGTQEEATEFASQKPWEALSLVAAGDEGLKCDRDSIWTSWNPNLPYYKDNGLYSTNSGRKQ